jgi:hypothetical protein
MHVSFHNTAGHAFVLWFIRLKRTWAGDAGQNAASPLDFLRHGAGVQWEVEERPLTASAIRGLTRTTFDF